MGTAFIFSTFIFSSNMFMTYSHTGENLSYFSVLLGLIGSVIGTYVGSAFFGKGRVGYKECIIGTITGGVVVSAAAPLIYSPGFMFFIGNVSGFLGGAYMRVLHPKVNKHYVKDAMGLL